MQCSARAKSTGRPCTRRAIRGGTVCIVHGGRAPQVKAKAEERIKALVNPALLLIEEYLDHVGDPDYPVPPAVRLNAARDILDRAGYSATHRLEMSGGLTFRSPIDVELEELAARLEQARKEMEDGAVGEATGSRGSAL